MKAEYPNQLDYSGHGERRIAPSEWEQVEARLEEPGDRCIWLTPDMRKHREAESKRPRADLNRDRWIQDPGC